MGVQPDNETLFNEWYGRNDERIHALCFDYLPELPTDEDVEDLAQEIYMRIWDNIKQFEGKSNFNTWANRVAVNVLNDHLDYQNADKRSVEIEEHDDERCIPYNQTPAVIREKLDLLSKYIDHLKGRDKSVIQMYCDGYNYRETADFLGITKAQVDHAIRRSKKLIRKMAKRDKDWGFGEVAV